MKVPVIGVCLAALFTLLLHAQDGRAAPVLDVDNRVLLGTCLPGEVISGSFEIRNKGDEALRIEGISTSCGCVTPNFVGPYTIAPGETYLLMVEIATEKNQHESFAKSIWIRSNDALSPLKEVYLDVQLRRHPQLQLRPDELDLDTLRTPEEISRKIHLHGITGYNFVLDEVTLKPDTVGIRIVIAQVQGTGTVKEVEFLIDPTQLPFGRFSFSTVIKGKFYDLLDPKAEPIPHQDEMAITGDNLLITPRVFVSQSRIMLGMSDQSSSSTRVTLAPNKKEDSILIKILSISDEQGLITTPMPLPATSRNDTPLELEIALLPHARGLVRTDVELSILIDEEPFTLTLPLLAYVKEN